MKKLLCISLLFSFSLSSFAGSVLKYSINVNSEKHKDKMTGKNYYQGKMYRNEIEVPVNENGKTKNEKLISIIRLDKEIIWSLIPEQNGYVEFTFEDLKKAYKKGKELVPGDNISGFYQMECKKIGSGEKMAGFETTKYECKNKDASGFSWLSSDEKLLEIISFWKEMSKIMNQTENSKLLSTSLPLKHKISNKKAQYEYNVLNFEKDKLSDSLFELPKGYKLIDIKVWEKYKDSFTMQGMMKIAAEKAKEEIKKQATEKVKDTAKENAKKAIKGLIKF